MICKTNDPAVRRYFNQVAASMLVYTLCIVVAVWEFVHRHPTGVMAYALAVLPALPIVAMLVAHGYCLAEMKDEFQRWIAILSLLWSLGATLAVTTIWGFLENFVQVPHLPGMMIFPLYCIFWGISAALVSWRYK